MSKNLVYVNARIPIFLADTGAMIHTTKTSDEHYTYIDLNQLYWDPTGAYWRPKGTVGDR